MAACHVAQLVKLKAKTTLQLEPFPLPHTAVCVSFLISLDYDDSLHMREPSVNNKRNLITLRGLNLLYAFPVSLLVHLHMGEGGGV